MFTSIVNICHSPRQNIIRRRAGQMAGAAETGNTGGNVGICEHPCDHAKQVRQAFARPVRSAHNMKYLCKHTAARCRPAREPLLEHAQRQSALKSRHLRLNSRTGVCPCYLPCAPCSPALQSSVNPNPAIHIIKTHTRTARPAHRNASAVFSATRPVPRAA